MNAIYTISLVLFVIAAFGVLLVFAFYPAIVWLASLSTPRRVSEANADATPSVSIIVAVRNAESLIQDKIENLNKLDYPREKVEIVFSLDGCTDSTEEIVAGCGEPNVRLVRNAVHDGKAVALNRAVQQARHHIILFSDADALLAPDALRRLAEHYRDPTVGGVCGQRVICRERADLKHAQSHYIKFDSRIKLYESRIGSITSNDGKIYSVRRDLFQPIADAVTDDLYTCLSIVEQHKRFVFEPEANAFIRLPSRSPRHEFLRRRRIVARSLHGIYLKRQVLNPFRYGSYSLALFVNKIVRRLVPFLLIAMLAASAIQASRSNVFVWITGLQALFYTSGLSYSLLARNPLIPGKALKACSIAFYFCIGMAGTLFGVLDFLGGKRVVKWDPVKTG